MIYYSQLTRADMCFKRQFVGELNNIKEFTKIRFFYNHVWILLTKLLLSQT